MPQDDTVQVNYNDFERASNWLSGAPEAASLPNDLKLELYGIFKYLTTKAGPSASRPSFLYPTARAKHDAWVTQAQSYSQLGQQVAQSRYVQIARHVGWIPETGDDGEGDIDFDAPDPSSSSSTQRKPTGMGTAVSSMARPDDVEALDKEDQSPIHDAVAADDIETVRRLLSAEASFVNLSDSLKGTTPLHIAADRGYVEMAVFLLDHGADSEAQDEDGQTPLMLAEVCGRDEIIELLVKRSQ